MLDAGLTAEVKQFALDQGADLVGIGSMDRFEGAPAHCDPRYIMPEAKAIVGLGFRIHRGSLRGIEEGTHFGSYPALGYANVNDVHAPVVLRQTGSFLEDEGYEAFLYGNSIVRYGINAGQPVREGLPKPDVFLHFRIAAYICGMGEIGWSKVFLTPQFGPRQRFAFILTEAPLVPDPIYDGPQLCDGCKRCVDDCPTGAISRDEAVEVEIAGHTLRWGALDLPKCNIGWQAASPEFNPFANDEVKALMDHYLNAEPGEIANPGEGGHKIGELFSYSKAGWRWFNHPGAICGGRGCVRGCMLQLEERGVLENKFREPFRRRRPWRMGQGAEAAGE